MRNVCRILLLALAAAFFCGCAFSADTPREPPQMSVSSLIGETAVQRFSWEWELMKARNEVGSGAVSDSTDPLLWEYEPIPVVTQENLVFVFPEGMEPDGMGADFYPLRDDGSADREAVRHLVMTPVSAADDAGTRGRWTVQLRRGSGLEAQDGIFVAEAIWNKPRYRGRATYAFAVTPRDF